MTHSALHTAICPLFGIEYPIVQTGMGWVAGARLAAATSAAGGLGILAAATMTEAQLVAAIADVKKSTNRPFGVNLRADQPDLGDRVALLIRERVKVASFAHAPSRDVVSRLKSAGIVTVVTVGAKRHAEKASLAGADALIAQGHEGGGHTGPVPTSLLLPQVIDTVDVPVLGAGGYFDGRGLVAALAYGAAGVAMGTRFLLTKESPVPNAVKQVYLNTKVTDTVVTTRIDGAPQRVIRTPLVRSLERSFGLLALASSIKHAWQLRMLTGATIPAWIREAARMREGRELTLSQLVMAANAPMYTKASMVDGHLESGIFPTGQCVGIIENLPSVADLIARIVADAEASLMRLSPKTQARALTAN